MKKTAKRTGTISSCFLVRAVCNVLAVALIMGLPVTAAAANRGEGGILQQEIEGRQDLISVKLLGVTEYEVTEMFNDLLNNASGVVEAKRYRLRLEPDNPGACIVVWQVRLEDTDAFQLESNLYRILRDVTGGDADVHKMALSFQPAAEDLALLKDIRPWRASSREIQFVFYRPLRPAPSGGKRPCEDGRKWRIWPDAGFE